MSKSTEDDLRTAFERAAKGKGSPETLISAVRNVVRDLKREGRPPENVIVTVKQLCGLPLLTFAADTDSGADGTGSGKISDIVFKAAIEEYYATPPSRGRPWNGQGAAIDD